MNAKKRSQQSIIAARRRRVSSLVLRGLTAREIVHALAFGEAPMHNPDTGKPWALGTIGGDLKRLKDEWRESAAADIAEHKAAQIAELAEVRRAAWAARDLELVRKCVMDEAKLLGTSAPAALEHQGELTVKVIYDDD